jgi:hypothetical protein
MSASISVITGTTKSFKLIKKQVPIRPNPSKKKGYDFVLETDFETMRENFRALVCSLPDSPGILVISGVLNSRSTTTEKVLSSDESVRIAFVSLGDRSAFNWLCKKMTDEGYKEIHFQLGR